MVDLFPDFWEVVILSSIMFISVYFPSSSGLGQLYIHVLTSIYFLQWLHWFKFQVAACKFSPFSTSSTVFVTLHILDFISSDGDSFDLYSLMVGHFDGLFCFRFSVYWSSIVFLLLRNVYSSHLPTS